VAGVEAVHPVALVALPEPVDLRERGRVPGQVVVAGWVALPASVGRGDDDGAPWPDDRGPGEFGVAVRRRPAKVAGLAVVAVGHTSPVAGQGEDTPVEPLAAEAYRSEGTAPAA